MKKTNHPISPTVYLWLAVAQLAVGVWNLWTAFAGSGTASTMQYLCGACFMLCAAMNFVLYRKNKKGDES